MWVLRLLRVASRLQATRDKLAAAESSNGALQEEAVTLKHSLRECEGELGAAQRAHATKAAALREDLAAEHQRACDAQSRCEALAAQLRSRDEECARQAREQRDVAHEHDGQARACS